ncbi:hypothetical protein AX16_000677 [Volvariella volvacea WC 439]|nr:hypothetical protein AX16_000677 [Volvariella volvacea WC 439]
MDFVSKLELTELVEVYHPTVNALLPLQEARREVITSYPKRTFKYGPTDRHQLDVYYPTSPFKSATLTETPVLFFVYGGGFTTGSRTLPPPADLVYGNFGAYFGSRGFIVVIADYRLAPDFKYPSALEDIRDALHWVVNHPSELVDPSGQGRTPGFVPPQPDTDSLIVLSQSAGASHALSIFLHPDILQPPSVLSSIRSKVAGLALFAGGYHFSMPDHNFEANCESHWGDMESAHKNCPRGFLLQLVARAEATSARDQSTGNGGGGGDIFADAKRHFPPNVLFIESERDAEWLKVARVDLLRDLTEKLGLTITDGVVGELNQTGRPDIRFVEAMGHNHVSPVFGLGIGEGEEWAEEFTSWVGGVLGSTGKYTCLS